MLHAALVFHPYRATRSYNLDTTATTPSIKVVMSASLEEQFILSLQSFVCLKQPTLFIHSLLFFSLYTYQQALLSTFKVSPTNQQHEVHHPRRRCCLRGPHCCRPCRCRPC